jgi:hypothetical protein
VPGGCLGVLTGVVTENQAEELIGFVSEGQIYRLALIRFPWLEDSTEEKERSFS